MKTLATAALAALTLTAIFPLATLAEGEDPDNLLPGALCNLYQAQSGSPENIAGSLSEKPAVWTFTDKESNFKSTERKEGIHTGWGIWTGWIKIEQTNTYTFLCKSNYIGHYFIWINGEKCESGNGQKAFNVKLNAGVNSVKIIVGDGFLTASFKKAGAETDYKPFGPKDMFREPPEEN